jgi:hypothetical protein
MRKKMEGGSNAVLQHVRVTNRSNLQASTDAFCK